MAKGLSVYLGEQPVSEIEHDCYLAKQMGFSKIFTSLHLPEVDYKPLLDEVKHIGHVCTSLKLALMVDISPSVFSYFTFDTFVNNMQQAGVSSLRIDFGISNESITKLSCIKGMKLVLNASTLLPSDFILLLEQGLNLENVEMCHNYYPRPETGLSEEFFNQQTDFYKAYGLPVSAFIAGKTKKRGPLFEGLPTLEKHRTIKSSLAFRHLQALGIDHIYFGDANLQEEEMKEIASLKNDAIALEAELFTHDPIARKVFELLHNARPDSSALVIRSQDSRLLLSTGKCRKVNIKPHNTVVRNIGDITIDNERYSRYAGELQICQQPLKQDQRVNVIGKLYEDNLFLLPYITPFRRFYFSNKKDY